jgi:hypothetical protein
MGMLEFGEYHGFYATYSLLSRHPALKAVSPQACISDFSLMIFTITDLFIELLEATPLLVFKDGTHYQCLVPISWKPKMIISFMNAGPLSNLDAFYGKTMNFATAKRAFQL